MSIKYEGKSPSRLWYIWQNAKGLAKSFSNPATAKDAKAGAKSGGLSTGVLVGGGILTKIGFIAILPIVPTVLSIAAVGGAGYFGLNAYRKFKVVKNSSAHKSFMQRQEKKWLDKKTRAPLMTRLKNAIGRKLDAIPRSLLSIAKWGGIGAAVAGFAASGAAALNALGIAAFSTGATATAVVAGVAKAGAIFGLTAAGATAAVTGLAVVAIPLGIALAVTAAKISSRANPDRSGSGTKRKFSAEAEARAAQMKSAPEATPKTTAKPKIATTFNDETAQAAPAARQEKKPAPEPEDDGLSEARKKAAAERAAARKRDRSKRFG
jgi:hypothetical protein